MARIPWNKGKKMSEEQRMVLSKVKTGKHPSTETLLKCSAGGVMAYFYGKENRERIMWQGEV
jgi:hypothetical protein